MALRLLLVLAVLGSAQAQADLGCTIDSIEELSAADFASKYEDKRPFILRGWAETAGVDTAAFSPSALSKSHGDAVVRAGSSVALHTRSLKYGKLQNGQLVTVPPALVKRLKQHFVALSCGVEIIIGTNGLLWITRAGGSGAHTTEHTGAAPEADALQRQRQRHAQTPIEPDVRERIARVHNSVVALVSLFAAVHPASIMAIYDQSVQMGLDAKALLDTEVVQRMPGLCRLELGSPQA